MQKTLLIAAATAALALVAAPASAAGHSWQVGKDSYNIHLSDLDLATAAGRAEALARVEKVAAKLCAGKGPRAERKACETRTIEASATGRIGAAVKLAIEERSSLRWSLAQSK